MNFRFKLKTVFIIISTIVFSYLFLIKFPQVIFGNCVKEENLKVYYHAGTNDEVSVVAKKALTLLKKSELYNPHDAYRVFLTGSDFEYRLFTNFFSHSGGFYYALGNAFIRPSVPLLDRAINISGSLSDDDRPLHYYIAHEATHNMTQCRIGPFKYLGLPVWLREGIAECVSRENPGFEKLLSYCRDSSDKLVEHGGYLRFKLRVDYLINIKKIKLCDLYNYKVDISLLDSEISNYAKNETLQTGSF